MPSAVLSHTRKRFALLVALLLFGSATRAEAQDAKEIEASLRGKALYLRGQWASNDLHFDIYGNPVKNSPLVAFTLSGIDVRSVSQGKNKLKISGRRIGIAFDPQGAIRRVVLEGKNYDGYVSIMIDGDPGADYSKALAAIFTSDLGTFYPRLPDYWRRYGRRFLSRPAIPAPAVASVDKTIAQPAMESAVDVQHPEAATAARPEHVGGLVKAPKVVASVDPSYNDAARMARLSGNVEIYLWVQEDGTPTHVEVVRPLGLGLDEQAVAAAYKYKFAPATRDGKPVRVDIYMDMNFQIF